MFEQVNSLTLLKVDSSSMRPFHYLILLLLPPLIGVLRTELPRWILEEISSPRGFIRTGTDPDAFVFRISRVSYIGNILPC